MITARHRSTALLVSGCYFMEMLDGTIVTTAAPRIGAALHAPATEIGLVVTAYLLTLAVLIPLSGWLTRRLGNRVVFLTAIALFTGASIGCAASGSLGELVAFRVLQGAGGAMMVPVGRMMVLSKADKGDILRLTSYVVWPGLIAPVIAPLAGGLITTYASWHWIFLINAPLGVVAFALAWRLVRDGRDEAVPPPLDWAGMLLTGVGLGGLTYAAHLVSLPAPPAAETALCFAGSAALLAAAFWHLRRAPHPLLNLRTLSSPTFRVTQLGGTGYMLVVGSMPFLLPLLFQTEFGWSPVKSGRADRVRLRRERGDQAGHHAADQPVRVPFGAGRVRARHRGVRRRARVHHRLDPGRADRAAGAGQRHHPVDGVHRLHHGRPGGHAGRADARRQHPRRHVDAARGRPGDRGLDGGAADRRCGHRQRRRRARPAAPGRAPSRSRSACSPSSRSAARPRRCGWTGGPATRPGGRATPPRRAGEVIPLFLGPLCR